jgi:ribosome-interacting GTPase 1
MPTNVTREYLDAQQKYSDAKTLEEKIDALKLMLSTVPKHKGTERLRYELKKNLANKRKELQARALKKTSSRSEFHIPKEGIAQILLIGAPNTGKSLILNKLTSTHAKVAPYPFTSNIPNPGMLLYKDVQIQLVELPPLVEEVSEGRWLGPKMLSTIRNSDALVIIIDLNRNPLEQMEMIFRELKATRIRLNRERPKIDIKRTDRGGIQIEGEIDEEDKPFVIGLMQSRGFHNASVIFLERVQRNRIQDAFDESLVFKRALIIANKGDLPGTETAFEELREHFGDDYPIIPVSAKRGLGLESVGSSIYSILGKMRIYTKVPGQKPESKPLVLPEGSTVKDVGKSLHRRFVNNFRFARVWGHSVNFGGEMVGLNHSLGDGDVVEFHAR